MITNHLLYSHLSYERSEKVSPTKPSKRALFLIIAVHLYHEHNGFEEDNVTNTVIIQLVQ
jgi:hypothetical protein